MPVRPAVLRTSVGYRRGGTYRVFTDIPPRKAASRATGANCGECGWWTPPFEKLSSAAFQLGGGLDNDKVGKEHFLARRSRDVGCGTLLSRQRDQLRGSKHVNDPKVVSLPKVSKGSDPAVQCTPGGF